MSTRTMRMVLVHDGKGLRRWEVELVEALAACPCVELAGHVIVSDPEQADRSRMNGWLARRIERRWARIPRWQRIPDDGPLSGMPRLDSSPHAHRTADVLLWLGDARPPVAPGGPEQWSFRWVGQQQRSPPTLLERAGGELSSTITLLRERAGQPPVLAWSGTFGVRDGDPASIHAVLGDMAQWPVRAAHASATMPAIPVPEQVDPGEPIPLRDRLRIAFAPLGRTQQERTRFLDDGRWNIGVLYQPAAALITEHASMNVRWLPAPAKGDHRRAPGGWLDTDGALHAIYAKKGADGEHIARVRPRRDNILKRSRILWSGKGPVGWTSLLLLHGEVHVVLGDRTEQAVRLLRLSADRDTMEPVAHLLDRPLESPVLFPHEGRWWLAGTDPTLADERLELFWADAPHGPFMPHAWGAVKTDVRSARPAGTPFMIDGQLYRPAVDATPGQAPRIALNRVIRLDPDVFAEQTVRHIGPVQGTAYPHGIRQMAVAGDLVLFDGLRTAEPLTYHQRGRRKKD